MDDDDDDDNKGLFEYRKRFPTAKTAVFWDVQGCGIADGLNALEVAQNIRSVLKEVNYSGPVSIFAYCDSEQQSWDDDLQSIAIVKYQKPTDEEDRLERFIMNRRRTASVYADPSHQSPAIVVNYTYTEADRIGLILADMLIWAMKNPPPANVMLIAGNISEHWEFILSFNHLYSAGYNLLLAHPRNVSAPRAFPVDTRLAWESLSAGEICLVPRDRSKPLDTGSRMLRPRFVLVGAGALAWIVLSSFLWRRS